MPDTILHKRNLTPGVAPTTESLSVGELAINVADKKLYTRSGSAIVILNDNTGSFSGSFTGVITSASYAETASYTPPTFIDNLVTVGLPGSDTTFTSIKSAVDSITDASVNNRYTVKVYPGIYIEDTITLKSFVSITGDGPEATIVSASDASASLFLGADQSFISDLRIDGVTAPSQSAILYYTSQSVASQGIMYVENVRFGANYTHAKMYPVSGGNAAMQLTNIKYGAQPFTLGFYITSDGISTGRMLLRNTTTTAGGIQSTTGLVFAKTDQPNCTLLANLVGLTKVGSGLAQGIGYWVENGGLLRVNTSNLQRFETGIYVPQVGAAPTIDAVGLNFENCTTDVNIIHSGSLGKIAGTDNFLKTLINKDAPLYEVNNDPRRITVGKKGADFSSISASVAFITDSAEDNRYVIEVGPGQYTENTIDLTGKPYVSIVGSNIQTTQIFPSSSTQHIIKMGVNNEISFLSLANAGSGYAAIYVDDVGDFAQAHKISIYDSDIGIQVLSRTQDTQFYGEYIDINGTFSYGTYVSASNNALCTVNVENYYLFPSGCAAIGNYVTHPSASLSLHTCTFQGDNTPSAVAIQMESGAEVEGTGLDIQDWDCGIKVPNVGDGPNFRLVGAMIHGSALHDMDILNPTTRGRYQGVADHTMITNASEDVYWNFLDDVDGENDITRKLSVTFADGTHTDATTLIFKGSPLGVMEGGIITTGSGFGITVASGFGYVRDAVDATVYKRIDWVNGNLTLTANSNNYIYITSAEVLTSAGSIPNNETNIILGRVVTNDTTVEFIDQTPYNGEHMSNKLSTFNREALGPVYAAGSTVTEDVTPFTLDVTAGTYFFSENEFNPAGTSSINLNQYYPSASVWGRYTSSIVPSSQYASASALVSMSAGYYTKHTLYGVGDGVDEKYFLVINSNQYSTLVEAENANLPSIPSYFNDGVVPLAAVYVQSGSANITQIQDIRPIIGFRAAGVNASSVHGNLLGLNADDHTQYLLVNGGRAMAGNLSLGGNDITNVGTMFGTASWANNAVNVDFSGITNTPSLVSSSLQINTGSFSGSITSASFATSASAATSITFTPSTASFATTSSFAQSASFATTASAATSITFIPTSASFASTASFVNALTTLTASNVQLTSIADTTATNKILVLNTSTNQVFTTASVNAISSSFATTSSFSITSSFVLPTGLPAGTVSQSSQVDVRNTTGIATLATTGSNVFIGNQRITGSLILSSSLPVELQVIGNTEITGSLSFNSGGVTGSVFGSSSFATTASFATSASFAPYGGLRTKAGSVANTSFAGNPKKATVTFTTAFPNTSYAVTVTGEDARSWTIESKAVGSFVISANSNTNLTGTTYWTAMTYGET